MILFSLHSHLVPEAIMQTSNTQMKYIQRIKTNKFNIVEYFQLFDFKNREVANKSFRDLINAILSLPTVGKGLASFAEYHYINDCAILDSDEAVLYWSEKVKKSIKQINDEIFMKKEKLNALQTLEKVNSLIETKNFDASSLNTKDETMKKDKETDNDVITHQLKREFSETSTIEHELKMTEVATNSSKPHELSITHLSEITAVDVADNAEQVPKIIDDINMSTFLANFRPILDNVQWYVGSRNVLKSWMMYKSVCAGKCNSEGLSIENDPQAVLALSHIMFIKSRGNSTSIADQFGRESMPVLLKSIKEKLGIKDRYAFNAIAAEETSIVLQSLLHKKTGKRRNTAKQIMNCAYTLPEHEYLILSELVSMVNYLPRKPTPGIANDTDSFLADYAMPVLRPLFENVNSKLKMKWWNSQHPNQNQDSQIEVYSILPSTRISLAFGKVTALTGDTQLDSFSISADLIGLAIRAKSTIDDHLQSKVRNVMFFHIVELKVTFYIMSLLQEGMYSMIDIAEIDIPSCAEDLLRFASNLHISLAVSQIFRDCCCALKIKNTERKGYFRPTLSTPKFDQLLGHRDF